MAVAKLEHLASVLRIWDDDNAKYGDHYQWCCVVRWITPTCVELMAAMTGLSYSQHKAAVKVLREYGITEYIYHRLRQDGSLQKLHKKPKQLQGGDGHDRS